MAEPRERWSRRSSFILAALGSAVGLGNLWRFPAIAAQNGGGAFLIPYFIALFTAGIPLLIVEFGLGHMFQGAAPMACKRANKKFEWVGWWSLACGSIIAFYYCVVMSWAWNYLVHSFSVAWRPPNSTDDYPVTFFTEKVLHLDANPAHLWGVVLPIVIGLAVTWLCIYWIICKGVTRVGKVVLITVPLPCVLLVVLFIRAITLPGAIAGMNVYLTPNFSQITNPKVWLAAYGQIFFSLSIGFGALIAYASFLPRKAEIGNNALITALGNCGTSFFAGMVVFSIIGFLAFAQTDAGFQKDSMVADAYVKHLKALNKPNALREDQPFDDEDTVLLTEMAALHKVDREELEGKHLKESIAPEHVRHFIAREAARVNGVSKEEVTDEQLWETATKYTAGEGGIGLAFKAFPVAISKMPGIWPVVVGLLFFVTLLSLGIDSAFSLVEGVVAALHDKFGISRLRASIGVCVVGFLAGLLFCTHAGLIWLDIVDHWINAYGLVGVGLFEAILVGWAYKTIKFKQHINSRSEIKIGIIWEICVKFVTPAVLVVTLIMAIYKELMVPYEGYPMWSLVVGGWLVAMAVLGAGLLLMYTGGRKEKTESQEK